ncbi:MAG: hypothetical protein ACQET5_11050 [Halobacteriota archaeon]
MVFVLSTDGVDRSLEPATFVDMVGDALVKQAAGKVERPQRPHFPVGASPDGRQPIGTGIAMPAYVHYAEHYATKLMGVHEENAERGLPTINARVTLAEHPNAFMAGTTIANARRGASCRERRVRDPRRRGGRDGLPAVGRGGRRHRGPAVVRATHGSTPRPSASCLVNATSAF